MAVVAIVGFALFVILGIAVTRFGEPAALLQVEAALFNHARVVAWRLTQTCYPMVLVPICIALLVLAALLPAWRTRILISIVTLLLAWRGADLFQHVFARPRPPQWAVKEETSFSYPSSHAAIATAFYGLWAAMLYFSELPRWLRVTAAALLSLLAVAIMWARLALGVHFITDLVGGILLAIVVVCIVFAVVEAVWGRVAGPLEHGKNRAV